MHSTYVLPQLVLLLFEIIYSNTMRLCINHCQFASTSVGARGTLCGAARDIDHTATAYTTTSNFTNVEHKMHPDVKHAGSSHVHYGSRHDFKPA